MRSHSCNSSMLSAAARSGRNPSVVRRAVSERSVVISPSPSPTKREKLPLPKNTVLLSLIEVANMVKKYSTSDMIPFSKSIPEAAKNSGTYVVATRKGLKVLPAMDKKHMKSLRNIFGRETYLNYGDQVQVVSIMDKWVKLSRGHGYIYLEDENDLVKVGAALDKACILESEMHVLSSRKKFMRKAKSKVEKDAAKMMVELRNILVSEKDLTIQKNPDNAHAVNKNLLPALGLSRFMESVVGTE
mmetsp:Transcript_22098/g.27898  ORF Transcript_22098/g.27898 Transcript_22098/m.27898 type:complete len:244 (+) Transcript_22098:2-733(+)